MLLKHMGVCIILLLDGNILFILEWLEWCEKNTI